MVSVDKEVRERKALLCSPLCIPVIDISDPEAGLHMVAACKDTGFFKLINHGIRPDCITELESEAFDFFHLPSSLKEKLGPAQPFGYGDKKIGRNGDIGWVEYLLFSTNPELSCLKQLSTFSDRFRKSMEEYMEAVKRLTVRVLELIAAGLGIENRNSFRRFLENEKSDCCFRINHYPPILPELRKLGGGGSLMGFGEHTDPQIISILRSNAGSGLQILDKDGLWISVPPDPDAFFINVGDSLQVMTNGRFRSVKHRVVIADGTNPRLSMIYFLGPAPDQKMVPLKELVSEGEEILYKEFTWSEYKAATYMTKLADYRLGYFERPASPRGLDASLHASVPIKPCPNSAE